MADQTVLAEILNVINDIKFTAFSPDTVELDDYLGGDLGIDSVEMLEIWYDIEKALNIKVEDHEKRDLYTLGHVLEKVTSKLEAPAEAIG
ncbi:acyl carrier protein [Gynuella sunshinyii]|uniref:Acyl carrier protein n=1 Tax=Gynuella sunshinyii YC6258 TaxID=1445510 RepID=A0A0C5W331_9GAMM|nr:acyl carrier protein [Gynuella sunshinyii]AJQ97074.1 acyl carrier protein [Gynuella sunshinyii YC6258]